jgi:hypothetical protein
MKRTNAAKEKRTKIFIGVIIAIFMVSSIAGVVLYRSDNNTGQNTQTISVGGKDYSIEQKIDGYNNPYFLMTSKTDSFSAYYLPGQLSYIMDNATQSYIKGMNYYYITFRPNDTGLQMIDYVRFDLRQNLQQSMYFADAVTERSDKYPLPVVNCMNATASSPVVLLESANRTNVSMKGNCITIDFAQYDALRIRDAFIYLSRGALLR